LNSNRNFDNRLNVDGNNHGDNRNSYAFEMALVSKADKMKSCKNLYPQITSEENLLKAYKKARKGKTTKYYVIEFRQNLKDNLQELKTELLLHSYKPKPLETFIVRDPKTRVISKSDFRDRVIHHALCNVIDSIFDKTFIYDSYANRKTKGTLATLERFDKFKRKVSRNGKNKGWFNNNQIKGYCLKADIKHYFEEIDHEILLNMIKRKIKCRKTIWLIGQILKNYSGGGENTKRHASWQPNKSILCQHLSKRT
jgi:RNA-directed DNA polymerase